MAERPMTDADYRVELHFAVRRKSFTKEEERKIALFFGEFSDLPIPLQDSPRLVAQLA